LSVEREGWSSWQSRQADAFFAAEADRQQTFFSMNVHLVERIQQGELLAFARRNDMAGEWIPVPVSAWQVLKVPFEPTFRNWQLGHATGGGLDLWDIRVLDVSGLPLQRAAIAYGPAKSASVVQRFLLKGDTDKEELSRKTEHKAPGASPGKLADKMAAIGPSIKYHSASDISLEEYKSALTVLNTNLLERLKCGRLLSFGQRPDGGRLAISRRDWQVGRPDFRNSQLEVNAVAFTSIVVRQPDPRGEAPQDGDIQVPWRNSDLDAWWTERVARHPTGRWPFNEEEDIAAAQQVFPKVDRAAFRTLRESVRDRVTRGRRPTTAAASENG
jgi:hypothetical protein